MMTKETIELVKLLSNRYHEHVKLLVKGSIKLYLNLCYQYYQKAGSPEKTMWAFEAFKRCTDSGIEIPTWVLAHIYEISNDLLVLVDKASTKETNNNDVLKAVGLKQMVKGGRSSISTFQRKKRDINIFSTIEMLREQAEKGNLEQNKTPFEIAGERYCMSEERARKIYYAVKKRLKELDQGHELG